MEAYTKFIDVRSRPGKKGKKKVYTKGYASTKGLFDKYKWMKGENGKIKSFRSLFTNECIEDMRRQLMAQTIFVDAQHTIATDEGILRILRGAGVSKEEIEQAREMLKVKKLPFAKPVGFDIDDYGFVFEAETNPWFAELDEDHESYYDAITNSIIDGYIKGYSINFDPIDSTTTVDESGNEWTRFSKVNLYGVSYTDNPSLETNLFTDVAVRSMMEVRNLKGGKMQEGKEEPEKVEEKKDSVGTTQTPPKPEGKVDVEAEVQKRVEEELKKKELEAQAKEQKLTMEQLQAQMDELRKKQEELIGSKTGKESVVPQVDKFAEVQNQGTQPNVLKDKEKTQELIGQIAAPHNQYMEDIRKGIHPSLARGRFMGGFGELIQLQGQMQTHKMRLPGESDNDYDRRMRMQDVSPSDDMVLKRTKQL